MGSPAAGAVVLVRFPFSDLSQTKVRPAILFTANQNLITSQIGYLEPDTLWSIAQAVVTIVTAGKLS